jgi:hypothetical protein
MISLGIPLFVLYVAGVPLAVYLILSSKQNLEKIRLINGVIYQPGFDVASLDPIDKESQAIKSADSAQDETKRHDQDEPAPIFDPETVAFLENYSFLFFGYSQKCFYWEVVILLRKAILSSIGVVLGFNARSQITFALLYLFSVTIFHSYQMPFAYSALNTFELFSLLTCSMTFFLGLFTLDANENTDMSYISDIAMVINFVYVVSVVSMAVFIKLEEKRREAEEKLIEKAKAELIEKEKLKQEAEISTDSDDAGISDQKLAVSSFNNYSVVTLTDYEATRATQLSYCKGDTIEVCD